MKRDLHELSRSRFDVLVIGGGIHGAAAAWDAALRGLSVALIERGDFGSATSQNSLKMIHGGLRYLQDGNLPRIRTMARERMIWMKIAPHLVHPLTCLTPTLPKLTRGRLAMRVALALNDLLSFDRNRLPDPQKNLPGSRIISRQECAQLLPGFPNARITGAAVWHDAQMYSSERLLLAFVISSARAGAVVANYVEANGFLQKNGAVCGVRARDVLSGLAFEIEAGVVINSAGAWVDQLLEGLEQQAARPRYAASVALNLVTRQVWDGCAAGLPTRPARGDANDGKARRSHMFFIVPWQGRSIIGTWHIPWPHPPDTFQITEAVLQEFTAEVNRAHRSLGLSLNDVQHVHWGFLPMLPPADADAPVKLVREGQVIDHQSEGGPAGLLSILGVKYTTARVIAQRAVDLAVRKLGLSGLPCRTHLVPLAGGHIERFSDFLGRAQAGCLAGLASDIIAHLVYTYGSEYDWLLDYLAEQPELGQRVIAGLPVIKAEVVHAVRAEMAHTLADVVQRRTELGATGLPELPALQACATLIGRELGWDIQQQAAAVEEVIHAYPIRHAAPSNQAEGLVE